MANQYGHCAARWHPDLWWGQCHEKDGHDGPHSGNAFRWEKPTKVDKATAEKFMHYYQRIPNSNHAITLNDDTTVTMTLNAFWAATNFIGVSMGGGD